MTLQIDDAAAAAVVVKAASGDSVERLLEETARLRAAAHPGVVEVTKAGPVDQGWELRLAYGGRPLAAVGQLTTRDVAKALASVAATLADLHTMGIVHGRIDAGHVLLGPDGRGVLCGFGPEPDEPAPTSADDVAALGCLLADLLGDAAEVEPIPDRRWALRRPRADHERRALLAIADHACAEDPTLRPSARRLAASMSAVAPCSIGDASADPARRPLEPEGAEEADTDPITQLRRHAAEPPTRRQPDRSLLLGGVGVLLLGVAVVRMMEPGALEARSSPSESLSPPATPSAPEVPTPSSALPLGAPDAVEVDGRVVTFDGRRFEVGQPGDVVVVGDWDCDGTPTLAVLRPRSGEVFAFDSWGTGEAVEVTPISRVPSAEALIARPASGGCTALAVRTTDQELVDIVAAPSAS